VFYALLQAHEQDILTRVIDNVHTRVAELIPADTKDPDWKVARDAIDLLAQLRPVSLHRHSADLLTDVLMADVLTTTCAFQVHARCPRTWL
jgi:hypothetical protein